MPPRDYPCARVRRGFVMGVVQTGITIVTLLRPRHAPAHAPTRLAQARPMPELPEVETTRRGLAPHLEGPQRDRRRSCAGRTCAGRSRRRSATLLPGQRIDAVRRRAKYLLLDTDAGSALLHLGMSGSLRVLPADTPVDAHDHVDLRRSTRDKAACCASTTRAASAACCGSRRARPTNCCAAWGPSRCRDDFDGDYLFARSRGRSAPVKTFLMDQGIVVGVGNIYAAEALFAAGISPLRAAGQGLARALRAAGRRGEAHPAPTRSSAAAPRCATSSAPTARRATSNRNCPPTAAAANPARAAGGR